MEVSNFTKGLTEIILEKNSEGENFFHEVTRSGSFSLIERFTPFISGSDAVEALNTRNNVGQMSIHVAAVTHKRWFAAKLIDILIKLGADINGQEGIEGNTTLHLAVKQRDYQLVEWLCHQQGIDLELRNGNNVSPFELAQKKKDEKMMQILKNYCSSENIIKVKVKRCHCLGMEW